MRISVTIIFFSKGREFRINANVIMIFVLPIYCILFLWYRNFYGIYNVLVCVYIYIYRNVDNLKANELTFDVSSDETSFVREMETCSLRGKLIPASKGILYRANSNFLFFSCIFFITTVIVRIYNFLISLII